MTIQRQYSLPNCTLMLEGFSDGNSTGQELRPVMSLLVSAECHLPGQEKPLTGGREFFESLVTAVSLYAQEFLSGIHLPGHVYSDRPSFVRLERLDRNHHRLNIDKDPGNPSAREQAVDLTTVQLFDLVEAIDQFVADTQTLPFWSLNLSPVPKRFAKSGDAIAKQAVPATIGVSGLALATLALFSLPTMKVRTPACLTAGAADCPSSSTNAKSSSPANPTASPNPSVSPEASISPEPSPGTSPAASPASPSPSPEASPSPNSAQLESVLNSAAAITDTGELQRLSNQLASQIRNNWKRPADVTDELAYRVGVAKNGDIVGYKPESQAAIDGVNKTPLLELLYIPADGSAPSSEPLAQFSVIFKQGDFEIRSVNPASIPSPSPAASPSPTSPTEITDRATLEKLQPTVYDLIDQAWRGQPSFEKDLVYRVRVKPDGTILDFRPENRQATNFIREIPLPQLGKQVESITPAQEPIASFKVVFKSSGVLQINPWYGLPRK
jgi:hypothetical protein